jgi:Tfp pilus assembly protein PilX
MAGNARRKDIAFHSAETALRGGEEWLRKQNPAPAHSVFNCQSTSGLYLGNCNNGTPIWDVLEASNSWATRAIQYIGKLAWVTNNPSYVVEEIQHGGILNDNLEVPLISPDATVYRITARGVGPGASPDSVAIVQSTFKKPQQ